MIYYIAICIIIVISPIIFYYWLNIESQVFAIIMTASITVAGFIFTSGINSQQIKQNLQTEKNIALWQDQKKLSFEFVEFLDREIFLILKLQVTTHINPKIILQRLIEC